MQPHNLFALLVERLLLHPNSFTMSTYNILFEVVIINEFEWKINLSLPLDSCGESQWTHC
jgi:hypothetical protein